VKWVRECDKHKLLRQSPLISMLKEKTREKMAKHEFSPEFATRKSFHIITCANRRTFKHFNDKDELSG
jgi:hypothetical protein